MRVSYLVSSLVRGCVSVQSLRMKQDESGAKERRGGVATRGVMEVVFVMPRFPLLLRTEQLDSSITVLDQDSIHLTFAAVQCCDYPPRP